MCVYQKLRKELRGCRDKNDLEYKYKSIVIDSRLKYEQKKSLNTINFTNLFFRLY